MADCGFAYRNAKTGEVVTFRALWEDQRGPLFEVAQKLKPAKADKLAAKGRSLTKIEAAYDDNGDWEEFRGARLVNGHLLDGGSPTGRRIRVQTWSQPMPEPRPMSPETAAEPATERQIAYARGLLGRAYDKGVPTSEIARMRAIIDGAPTKAQASKIIGDISGDTIY